MEFGHGDAVEQAEQRADCAGNKQAERNNQPGIQTRERIGEQGHGFCRNHRGKPRYISDAQINAGIAGQKYEHQADCADHVIGIGGEHGNNICHRKEIAVQKAHHNTDRGQHVYDRQIQGEPSKTAPQAVIFDRR